MIKSPCRECERHECEFPTCFNHCETIRRVQKECRNNESHIKTNLTYVPSENHSFAHRSTNHKAMS